MFFFINFTTFVVGHIDWKCFYVILCASAVPYHKYNEYYNMRIFLILSSISVLLQCIF